ncbi:MAG: hypothetical protein K2O24_05610 [Muribaculaceae bacterium]|nr:hypothetical protein [Muribaculaceae bacterium]
MKYRNSLFPVIAIAMILWCAGMAFAAEPKVPLPRKELAELRRVIGHADAYSGQRAARLYAMRDSLRLPADMRLRWTTAYRLGEEWLTFNADSALYYSRVALKMATRTNDPALVARSRMQEVRCLTSVGLLMWAQPEFMELDTVGYDDSMMADYWKTARHFSYTASGIAGGLEPYEEEAQKWYAEADEKLLDVLPPDEPYTRYLMCERQATAGRYAQAKENLEKLLSTLQPADNLYGMTAFRLAAVYRLQGDEANYARYITLAAISDIKGAVREGWALPALAIFLYEQGDLDDAYKYLNFAFREATMSSSRIRTLDIARVVPMIDEAYRHEITASRDKMVTYFVLTAFLMILLVGLSFGLWRQIKRGRSNARRLAMITKRQESYIGNFVDLCASYSARFEAMSKTVTRKLSSGQADELLKMINSGKLGLTEQDEDLHKVIDAAFLDLYPTFVDEINTLLKPDSRMELKTPGVLTPELRICAMIRLGVDSGTRIAKILGYSVNTVYSYRNRMRQRATDPEKFTENIMKIGRADEDL